jgi:hypothetical protein
MKEHPLESELWILSKVVDDNDPAWSERLVVICSPELRSQLSQRGVPAGWRLYRGEKAERFLEKGASDERRWRGEQRTRRDAGGQN